MSQSPIKKRGKSERVLESQDYFSSPEDQDGSVNTDGATVDDPNDGLVIIDINEDNKDMDNNTDNNNKGISEANEVSNDDMHEVSNVDIDGSTSVAASDEAVGYADNSEDVVSPTVATEDDAANHSKDAFRQRFHRKLPGVKSIKSRKAFPHGVNSKA